MSIHTALAAVSVSDLAEAKEFYTRLFERGPDLEPMPGLAQWDLAAGGVQVVEDAKRSGRGLVTLMAAGFDGVVAALDDRGVPHGGVVDGIACLVQVEDPAGNTITLVESSDAV